MRRLLDFLMRRKGRFLLIVPAFLLSEQLGYNIVIVCQAGAAETAAAPTEAVIEVPRTGAGVETTAKEPADAHAKPKTASKQPSQCYVSAYSGGRTTAGAGKRQLATFPFDLRPPVVATEAAQAQPAKTETWRRVVKAVATGVLTCSALALVGHVVSDRYLR